MRYLPGEKIRVTCEGTVANLIDGDDVNWAEGDWPELRLYVESVLGGVALPIPLGWENVVIERLVPAAGMPKKGEVWQDGEGQRYFAIADAHGNRELMASDGLRYPLESISQLPPPLTPLIQDPTPEPAPEPSADEEVPW